MSFIINNYLLIIAAIVLIVALLIVVFKFLKLSEEEREERILAVLVNLTYVAEETLGSKTGSLKRSQVYSQFKKLCPFLACFISMETFDCLLDKAILIMEETISQREGE